MKSKKLKMKLRINYTEEKQEKEESVNVPKHEKNQRKYGKMKTLKQ